LSRLRIFFLFAATIALAVAFAACGGSSDSSSTSDVNPQKVLDQTFSGNSSIDSGNVDASIKLEASGSQSGTFDIGVSGPFDSNGSGTPKFDMTAKVSGDFSGQSLDFEGSAISTGDAAYIGYQGTDYALSAQQYSSFTKVFDQSSSQNNNQGNLPGLKDSLTDLTNEGEADVEGTNTIHVSGSVDPAKFSDAIKSAVDQGAASGANQAQLQQLQAAIPQLDQLSSSVKSATFDVYSGVDDHLLRKLDFNADIAPPGGSEAKIGFDLTLGDVNKPQTVSAPSSSQPLDNLLKKFAPFLGGLGAQIGSSGGTTGGTTGGGSSTPVAPSTANSALLQCLQSATTAAEVQACAGQ
jgi:hypothetical protein